MTEFLTPVEWLVRLGAQLKDFYDFQCREAKRIFEEKRTSTLKTAPSSVRRAAKQVAVPASVQKSTKVSFPFKLAPNALITLLEESTTKHFGK